MRKTSKNQKNKHLLRSTFICPDFLNSNSLKTAIPLILIFISCISFISNDHGYKKTFKELQRLQGTWIMKGNKMSFGESWSKKNKRYLQSRGFIIKNQDTIYTETVALRRDDQGISYTSTVTGQNNNEPVSFKLTSALNQTYVFENPTHDFPKRIIYSFVSNDSLHAWIDDGMKESKKQQHFYYSRIK
jgi:hypothetical protein